MARTGRFGRLPTESPDLSSQIASLMEQYAAAEDRNILDAWTNGGTYKGKKVTDKDILKHYRNRRDRYTKDEPEYDQWSQDLWQLRYQIADEKVTQKYKTGKIGPRAVAQHYKKWANKMPKNSSFYRNLMAAYGDFMKAATASGGSGGGGSRGFDWAALQRDIAALDKKQRESDEALSLANDYARSRGFIGAEDDIFTPGALNIYESGEMKMMFDGLMESPEYKAWRRGRKQEWGYSTIDEDTLDMDNLRQMARDRIRYSQQKIARYKAYPGDLSSLVEEERKKVRESKRFLRLSKAGSVIDTRVAVRDEWLEWMGQPGDGSGWASNMSPSAAVDGARDMEKELRQAALSSYRQGDDVAGLAFELVADVFRDSRIAGTGGDSAAVEAANERIAEFQRNYPDFATDMFGTFFQTGTVNQFQVTLQSVFAGAQMLQDGTGVKIVLDKQATGTQALGASAELGYIVAAYEKDDDGIASITDPATGERIVVQPGRVELVDEMHINPDGTIRWEKRALFAKQIVDSNGNEIAVELDWDGDRRYGVRQDGGSYLYSYINPFDETGATLDRTTGANENVIYARWGIEQPSFDEETGTYPGFGQVADIASYAEELNDYIVQTEDVDVGSEATEATKESKLATLDKMQSNVVNEDMAAILDDPEQVALFVGQHSKSVSTGALETYAGTEDEAGANRAVAKEIMRRKYGLTGEAFEYDVESARYIASTGGLRPYTVYTESESREEGSLGPAALAAEVTRRNELQQQAESGNISIEQVFSDAMVQERAASAGLRTGREAEGFDFSGTAERDPMNSSVWQDYTETDEGKQSLDQYGWEASGKAFSRWMTEGIGVESLALSYWLTDPEQQKYADESLNKVVESVMMTATSQAMADEMLDDVATVMAMGDQAPMYAKLAADTAITEQERGLIVGFARNWTSARNDLATIVGGLDDEVTGGITPFGESDDEVKNAGWFNVNAAGGPTGIAAGPMSETTNFNASASEVGVTAREQVSAEPKSTSIKMVSPLAAVSGFKDASVKAIGQIKSAQEVSGAVTRASAPSAMSPITTVKPTSVSISPVRVGGASTFAVNVPSASSVSALASDARSATPYSYGTRNVGGVQVDTVQGNGVSGYR